MRFIAILMLLTFIATAEKKTKAEMLTINNLVMSEASFSGKSTEWKSKDELHKKYIKKFIAAPDFGASRIVRIDIDRFKTLTVDNKNYRVKSMELISVTDRKKPVLWETNGILNRTFLEKKFIKHRELTKVEKINFDKLKNGEKFITVKENDVLTMMGTLKAETSCVRCHEDYKLGEFMGAFKYTFYDAGTSLQIKKTEKPATKKIEKKGETVSKPEVG